MLCISELTESIASHEGQITQAIIDLAARLLFVRSNVTGIQLSMECISFMYSFDEKASMA